MKNLYSSSVALVVAAIPTYLLRLNFFGVPTNVFEVLVLGLALTGLLLPAVRSRWRRAEQSAPRPVVYCVGLFVVAALVSAILADVPRVSFGIFKSWIIIPILLGWFVYVEARNKKLETMIYLALISSGVIISILSLTQFRWGERLAGIYDVPNSLALYLAPLVVLAVTQAFSPPYEGGVPRLWRGEGVIYGIAALLMSFTLLFTQSIAGIAAVLTIVGVILISHIRTFPHFEIWKGRRLLQVVTIILALLGSIVWYLSATGRLAYIASPLITGEPNSLSVRLQLWDISWDLIKEHPLLGIGLGQFEPAYQEKLHERISNFEFRISNLKTNSPPLREFVFRDPHNWLLAFWLNTGLLGLISFAVLHMWLFWKARHLLATNYQLQATVAALLVLLLFGLVDTIYWKNDLAALHWVLLGLLLGSGSRREL